MQQPMQQPGSVSIDPQQGQKFSSTLNKEKSKEKARASINTVEERQAAIDASKYASFGFAGGFFLAMVSTLVLRWILNAFIQDESHKYTIVTKNGDGIWTTKNS